MTISAVSPSGVLCRDFAVLLRLAERLGEAFVYHCPAHTRRRPSSPGARVGLERPDDVPRSPCNTHIVRAFLRGIDYDPDSQAGKAHFWVVPADVGGPYQPNPGGRGRRSDLAEGGLTKSEQAADGPGSLLGLVSGATRYAKKKSAAQGGASSFDMVAGGGFEPPTSGL